MAHLTIVVLFALSLQRPHMIMVPETMSIDSIFIDSLVLRGMVKHFIENAPNESAVCLYGVVRTHLRPGNARYQHVIVDSMTPAAADSATPTRFYARKEIPSGCMSSTTAIGEELLVGTMHPHFNSRCNPFTNSLVDTPSAYDAIFNIEDPRTLFIGVVCSDGWMVILFVDGRRWASRWAKVP